MTYSMNNKVKSTHTSLPEVYGGEWQRSSYILRKEGKIHPKDTSPWADCHFFSNHKNLSRVSDTIDIDVCSYADIQQ